jgi:predicted ATP-binding protein involved in virulence
MRLKKVTLTNFRCFDELEIELHPDLTVLVADNGGGKTSVLDGIAVGLSPILRYLSTANQRLEGVGFKDTDFMLKQAKVKGRPTWIASDFARVSVDTISGLSWDIHGVPSKGKSQSQPEKIGQSKLSAYLGKILTSIDNNGYENVPVCAYYGTRRGWIDIPQRLHVSGINYEYPTSGLSGALDANSDFKELLKWFNQEEASELRSEKEPLESPFKYPALECVRTVIPKLLGGVYRNPKFDARGRFTVDAEEGTKVIEVSQLSQGYQSMLAVGMDFARRLALANPDISKYHLDADWREYDEPISPANAPAVMLVDEIDLHLHPSWQQRVLGDLMRAFPGTQFIVTTHSPQVLTTVRKENIRIIEKDVDGKWVARMPEHSPLSHGSGDALAEIMGVTSIPMNSQSQRDLLEAVHDYEQLIRGGMEGEVPAMAVKAKLDAEGYEIPEASLALWRFMGEKVKQMR